MRPDDSTAQRVNRLIDRGRGPEPPITDDAWPPGWPSENASAGADSGESRARLTESLGFGAGPRWQVSPRAVAAVVVLALVTVLGVGFLAVRGPGPGSTVPLRAPGPFDPVATSALGSATGSGTSPPTGAAGSTVPAGPAGVGPLRVYVVGQVRRPGVVSLAEGARVEDAVQAVGGATGKADLAVMNLARKVVDGERIIVPRPGEKLPTPEPVAVPGAGEPGATGADGSAGGAAAGGPLDLNTATVAQLDTLPGVGPVLAGRIVAWRQENGRFTTVDDLGEVQGIGDATLARLRPLVRV